MYVSRNFIVTKHSLKMNNFNYLKKYLRQNQYYDLEDEILVQVESHPNFPSLYAIIDTFTYLEIENVAVKAEKEEFDNLPENFIAVVDSDTGKETVFTEKLKDKVRIEFSNGFKKIMTKTEFLTIWSGIVVAIEKNEISSKLNFSGKNNLIAGTFFFVSLVMVFLNNNEYLRVSLVYYLLIIIGLIISVFLIREEIGIHNESISKICNVNEKTSCKAVLSSKGAKIIGDISLSDACLVCFSAIAFLSLFSTFENSFSIYLSFAFCSIPVLIYSFYYQYFVLKKWCVLCLGIAVVLLFQTILVLNSLSKIDISFKATHMIPFVFILSLISIIWIKGKALFKKNMVLKSTEIKYNQLKRKELVFTTLLSNNQQIETNDLDEIKTIVIGQVEAPVTLYAVLSASCGHCHSAYENILKLIHKKPQEIKAKIIFNVNIKNEDNPTNKVYQQVSHYYFNNETNKAQEALSDWHIKKMTLENWKTKWGSTEDPFSDEIMQQQYNWCYKNDLLFTPAIIINGSVLPKEYQINELSYFLENLIENKKAAL
jgi:uncharacterized membrane protein/RNAse (barnase) inhibitor barstar